MSQPTVAAEIHQPLDVHGHLAPKVALDDVVAVDDLADLQHFLVGMLTPAMRATVIHSYCRRKRSGRRSSRGRFANDNATPSPFPRARYRSTSQLGCGLLMDSTAFRQPPAGCAFARSRLPAGALVPARFGGLGLRFQRLAGRVFDASGTRPPTAGLGVLGRWGLGSYLRRPRGWLFGGGTAKHPIDGTSHLRDRRHSID